MLRISGGAYRGRNIAVPEEGTVPTKNRVREAMMSMVSSYLSDACVLDLFAGSGALGIEALSRGASKAVFVDASPKAARIIKENLILLKETRGTVLQGDYLAMAGRMDEPFSLVFLDPPYAMKEAYSKAIDALESHGLLASHCAIVLEYEGDLALDVPSFSERRDYVYGKSKVVLLKR